MKTTLTELSEAKRLLQRSKSVSNVTFKQVAYHLGTSFQRVDNMFHHDATHMRVADLLKLSKHPDMREFVQQILVAIQANVDHQQLRVCDLDAMSTTRPDAARAALLTVAGRLWPEIGPVNSQTPETVDNGSDTRPADDLPVRVARTSRASTAHRSGSTLADGRRRPTGF